MLGSLPLETRTLESKGSGEARTPRTPSAPAISKSRGALLSAFGMATRG